jgi:hypothetical protein
MLSVSHQGRKGDALSPALRTLQVSILLLSKLPKAGLEVTQVNLLAIIYTRH